MIVSLVQESEWIVAFSSLPLWRPPQSPMLVIAPHPDDETLGAGGLIASQRLRGVDVSIAAVTDGEASYPGSPHLAEVRRLEQTEALSRLGVTSSKIARLGLPDSNVSSRENDLVERLKSLVSKDTHLVAPWPRDFHPDHEACGRAAEQVARETGARLTFYFFWTWHHGQPELFADLPLHRFPLTPELLHAKAEALACHRSQLIWDHGDPILPESLLAPARRSFEVFLPA